MECQEVKQLECDAKLSEKVDEVGEIIGGIPPLNPRRPKPQMPPPPEASSSFFPVMGLHFCVHFCVVFGVDMEYNLRCFAGGFPKKTILHPRCQ